MSRLVMTILAVLFALGIAGAAKADCGASHATTASQTPVPATVAETTTKTTTTVKPEGGTGG
jgi:hypothetical protein